MRKQAAFATNTKFVPMKEEQSRARLVERIRLLRLSGDLLEFSLTMAIFFALLLGLWSDSLVRGGSDQSHRRDLCGRASRE
jgi:hypothetical protein